MMPTYLRHEQGMLYIPAHANCEWELYRAFPFHCQSGVGTVGLQLE